MTKPEHFTRFVGRLAKITTSEPVDGAKFFEGRLAGFADGNVRVTLKGKEGRTVELPLQMIRKGESGGGVLVEVGSRFAGEDKGAQPRLTVPRSIQR